MCIHVLIYTYANRLHLFFYHVYHYRAKRVLFFVCSAVVVYICVGYNLYVKVAFFVLIMTVDRDKRVSRGSFVFFEVDEKRFLELYLARYGSTSSVLFK